MNPVPTDDIFAATAKKEPRKEDWLRSIGLESYIAAFQAEGIAVDQLFTLTEADLKELGLTLGDRKRFFAGIASNPPTLPVEKRPLTIMFVDIVGSSALGEELSLEDYLALIRKYRDLCGAPITRFGGKVARFAGDGILAYFCYPIANENDPERAARAALEIIRGIGSLKTPDGKQVPVRIGLATGIVVVGDLVGGGETEIQGVVGSTANLAARLQALATPNGIVVSEQTYSRIRRRFDCERMTPVQLRGFAGIEQPWNVTGERATRGEAARRLGGSQTTPLIGRQIELQSLRDLWALASTGTGQIAFIFGEAGIGKSRLIRQFLEDILPTDAALTELSGSPFDTDSPLRPFIDLLRAEPALASGCTDPDPLASKLIAQLLQPDPPDPALNALTPDQLRERTVKLLARLLRAPGQAQPHCVLIEDTHWLDPTSHEALSLLVDGIAATRTMLILASRDDVAWLPQTATSIPLQRLEPRATARLLTFLLGDLYLSAATVDHIVERTDGVPLFVEEVARTLAATGTIADGDEHEIPSSLHEAFVARIDRAAGAKQAAQAASVIGRSFQRDVLARVSDVTGQALDTALANLISAGVLEQDLERRDTYVFSHALLRDAAYGGLLRDRLRELHARAATALSCLNPGLLREQPEIIAAHLTAAEKALEAAPLWLQAAHRSLSQSALTEAVRLLRRGLSALEHLPPTQETLRLRLQLAAPLGTALMGLYGPFAPETQTHYNTAYELSRELPEEEAHFPIYWGWWRVAPDYYAHLKRAASLLERAQARGDPALLLQAHHCSWAINFHVGDLKRCCEHMRAGLEIYHAGGYRQHAELYGNHDAKVCAHGGLCQLYWMQGKLRSAEQEEAASLHWAEQLDHLGSSIHALGLTLLYRVYRQDESAVLARTRLLQALTHEYGIKEHDAAATLFRGWALARRGDPKGLDMIEDGFARQREVASTEDFPVYLCLLAEVLIGQGRAGEAASRLIEERAALESTGLRLWIPELLRVAADTMLTADPSKLARPLALLNEAEDMAESQGVSMLLLRIARTRLRLATLTDAESIPGALKRLRDALTRIPEPDDSTELRETERLLHANSDV